MTATATVAAVVLATAVSPRDGGLPPLYTAGVARSASGVLTPVWPDTSLRFVPGTSVLERPGADQAADQAAVLESRAWLARGLVPGAGTAYAPMGTRALLDVRAMTRPNGAVIAGWTDRWRYVWPRDTSFAIAALSASGHRAEAEGALAYLVSIAPADGRWRARYTTDGSGRTPDQRGMQLDGGGWFLWAAWYWSTTERAAGRDPQVRLASSWGRLAASADHLAASLGAGGLPPASSDYWERDEKDLTLGVVLPTLLGLRSAADLAAREESRATEAVRWSAAAVRLDERIRAVFGRAGYPRTIRGGRPDSISALLGRPFFPDNVQASTVVEAARRLQLANGGYAPGGDWKHDGIAWTPETALFGLHFAANGDAARADAVLDWLTGHRTALGVLPEKVLSSGRPASVAPLTWTAALVVLTLVALDRPLPAPPVPSATN